MRRLALFLVFVATALPALAQEARPLDRAAIEGVVRDLLRREPDLVLDALREIEARRQRETEARGRLALSERKNELLNDEDSPVHGNRNGDVTLVEFFDYKCPYCKQVAPAIQALVESDPKLRVVYKELPVLGKESVFAAKAALAAHRQGKYLPLHAALIGLRGPLTDDAVLKAATAAGLDMARLREDMNSAAVEGALQKNQALAQALGIRGTPAFAVGDTLIPGAVDVETLRKSIADVRKGS